MRITLFVLLLALSSQITFAQNDGILPRHPAISPDAEKITFSYQGDIWTADTDGSNAKRLTIHEAYEEAPDRKSVV